MNPPKTLVFVGEQDVHKLNHKTYFKRISTGVWRYYQDGKPEMGFVELHGSRRRAKQYARRLNRNYKSPLPSFATFRIYVPIELYD